MTAFHAWRVGIRRVLSAPSLVVVVWMTTTAVSLPLALAMRAGIADNLGHSLSADAAARGMNYEWMQEFSGQSTGLATTLRPTIVGFAAVLDNLSAYVDDVRRPAAVAAASGVYVLVWIVLSGAIITRYAGGRVSFAYSFRFFRLAILTAIAYGLLFGALHPLLFSTIYPRLTRGVELERTAFMVRAGLYAVFVVALAAVNVVFDYAKVRAVVEDRRSMAMAIVASWRFIRAHAARALGVYLIDAAMFAALLGAYAMVAPPGGGIGMMVWPTVAIGQAYIAGRLGVRLLFFASETALVQATLKGSSYAD